MAWSNFRLADTLEIALGRRDSGLYVSIGEIALGNMPGNGIRPFEIVALDGCQCVRNHRRNTRNPPCYMVEA
jgi:hypothetical protein